MRLTPAFVRRHVPRALGWTLAGGAALQVAAAAGVIAVDELRKRRDASETRFPSSEPRTIDIAGTSVTSYTRGATLYDDMIEAIDSATELVLLES